MNEAPLGHVPDENVQAITTIVDQIYKEKQIPFYVAAGINLKTIVDTTKRNFLAYLCVPLSPLFVATTAEFRTLMKQNTGGTDETFELTVDTYRESVNVRVVIRRFLFQFLKQKSQVEVARFLVWCNEFPWMEYNFATYHKIRFNSLIRQPGPGDQEEQERSKILERALDLDSSVGGKKYAKFVFS